jgi:23S rRNA (adenine2503-C2)-methyltransferase
VTIEYTLLAGRERSAEDAQRLAEIARSLPSKINLIPYNPVPGLSWKRPSREAVDGFVHAALSGGSRGGRVRHTMGGEIWAAAASSEADAGSMSPGTSRPALTLPHPAAAGVSSRWR